MNRTIILCAAMLLSTAPLCTAAQATDKTSILLQRLADPSGSGRAEVLVGKLPPNLPSVPLPAAEIIGSVHVKADLSIGTFDSYALYFTGSADSLTRYGAALTAAGWKMSAFPELVRQGGFTTNEPPSVAMYCRVGSPSVSAQLVGANSEDLRVSITAGNGILDMACQNEGMVANMFERMHTPLPDLHAPVGVRMSVSQAGNPGGTSGAYLKGGSSASGLLDGFASQFSSADWTPGTKSATATIASQTFHIVDKKKTPWQCVLTVYAVDAKPGEFIAFVDVTNLATLGRASPGTYTTFRAP